ncbi:MAG: hypothetical protein N2315_05185 [Thermanaerothrix sp.]|nr:hypothetical protein [Thermanaerothrix sp.]
MTAVRPSASTLVGLACLILLGAAALTDLPGFYALSAGAGALSRVLKKRGL